MSVHVHFHESHGQESPHVFIIKIHMLLTIGSQQPLVRGEAGFKTQPHGEAGFKTQPHGEAGFKTQPHDHMVKQGLKLSPMTMVKQGSKLSPMTIW